MADANVRASDPRNYQLSGKVSAWFKPAGATRFVDVGNVKDSKFTPNEQTLPHLSNRRGVQAKDAELITERTGKLDFIIDEINRTNLKFAFNSEGDAEASTIDVEDDKPVANPGSGETIDLGVTDLVPGSMLVRNVNEEDDVTYVENTDYSVNYATGVITILAGALASADPDSGVPEIHCQWTKNVESQSFEICPGTQVSGEAKIQVLTDEGIKYVAHWKKVIMKNNGAINIGDGAAYAEIPLTIETLEDSDGKIGTCHVINADELP